MNALVSEINAVGKALQDLLADDEDALIVGVGAVQQNADLDEKSCIVSITGLVGGERKTFTGNAIALLDSAWIARGKLRIAREAAAKKRAEAKGGAA